MSPLSPWLKALLLPEFERRGIGSALLGAIIKRARRDIPVRRVTLQQNRAAAGSGFARAGERKRT